MGRCDPYDFRWGVPDCSTVCDRLVTLLEETLGIEIDSNNEEDEEDFHTRVLAALDCVKLVAL